MAKILLVDDDPQVRAVLLGFLQIGGHEVLEAGNGLQASKILEKQLPDLVITDIVMPESDGFELIMSSNRKDQPIKIIAITGGSPNLAQQTLLTIAQKMPINKVLSKPVTCEELLAAVQDVLNSPENNRHAQTNLNA
ncbi:Response regulator receiver domain-containing protein [Trichlorobacter thiogenes]|uniref:Response regulator receiver domain-containing protein n=1 Tax=Trichlorobacter thiogenes TaxID=115783 RepID=A0A1T4QQ16_9BACT|nr:response regulator [Trichlorobacter thiogenes]SKA05872.1 Response regulator receiver domain-containing protein [Trichlorobacter thiogenes]